MRFLWLCMVLATALGDPCAEVYTLGVWAWTASAAAGHGCPLCNQSLGNTTPPACACARGSVYTGNATLEGGCALCAHGKFCAGGTSPAQHCPANSAAPPGSGALEDCTCADFFRATPAHGCERCPPTHICRNGTATPCPADARAFHDADACTCVSGTFSNGTCTPCAPGHYCPGGAHPAVPCPPHSTSRARASSAAACHCLPPYVGVDHGLAMCVDASKVTTSLVVRGEDLDALAPGSVVLVDAQPRCASGLCPGNIGAQVHNATHMTLHLFNVIVRPAYLALLYDFLAGAELVATSYVAVRQAWQPDAHGVAPAWRCTVAVNTTARAGDDPAALHRTAAEARWNALVRLDPVAMAEGPPTRGAGALRGRVTWQLTGAHTHGAVSEGLDTCGLSVAAQGRGGVTVGPDEAGTGTVVSVEDMACPTLDVLGCLQNAGGLGGLAPGSTVVCMSHSAVIVRGDARPELTDACLPGYLATEWNVTASASEAIAFVQNRADVHVVGTVAVRVAPHTMPTEATDLLWARNTTAWQAGGEVPHPSVDTLTRIFRLLGLGPPHFTREGHTHGAEVHVTAAPGSGPGHVRISSTGVLLRARDMVALLHALQEAAGVSVAPIGTYWRVGAVGAADAGETVVQNEAAPGAPTLSTAWLDGTGTTRRPLGEVVNMTTTVTGVVALHGAAPRVYAAGVDTGRTWFPAPNASACADLNATVHAQDLWTGIVTEYALLPSTTLLSLLRHTMFHRDATASTHLADAATYPGEAVPTVAFQTRGHACDADAVRNPAFSDETLGAILARMANGAHVEFVDFCETTCVRDGSLESTHAADAVAQGVRAWNTTAAWDAGATLAWLHAFRDVATPDLAVTHTAVLATPNASAVAALGLGIWLTSAVAIPASPLGILAQAGGLGAHERDPDACAGSGCEGRVLVHAPFRAALCLDIAAQNHGLFLDGVLRESRRALAAATVLSVAEQRVTAMLALPADAGQTTAPDVLAQLRAMGAHVTVSPARRWHELSIDCTYAPAEYAPAPEALRMILWDEVAVHAPLALSQLPHSSATISFEMALATPIDGLNPDTMWLMGPSIEAELGVVLAGAAVRMLTVTADAEFDVVITAEADLPEDLLCAEAWARLARIAENGTIASLEMHAVVVASACRVGVRLYSTLDTSPAARALESRALVRAARNVTWSVTEAPATVPQFAIANVSAPDLAVFDRAAAALFDIGPAAPAPIGHLEHHVRLCGFASPGQVTRAVAHLSAPFGMPALLLFVLQVLALLGAQEMLALLFAGPCPARCARDACLLGAQEMLACSVRKRCLPARCARDACVAVCRSLPCSVCKRCLRCFFPGFASPCVPAVTHHTTLRGASSRPRRYQIWQGLQRQT